VITGYLARRAGLSAGAYTSINHPKAGRLEAVLRALRAEKLDVPRSSRFSRVASRSWSMRC
jgi:hypothetical protein